MNKFFVILSCLALLVVNGCDAVYFPSGDNVPDGAAKEIRVLTLKDPLIYQKDSRGHASGMDYDLLEDFARARGLHFTYVVKKDEVTLLAALEHGEGDVAAARLPGELLALRGYLEGPAYEETRLSLFCQNSAKVKDIADLQNRSVAILKKDSELLIENRLPLLAPGAQLQKLSGGNALQLLKETSDGRYDCAILEDSQGRYFLRNFPELSFIRPVSDFYSLNWILSPEHSDLQNQMFRWFQEASRHDDIVRVQERYESFVEVLLPRDVKRFTGRISEILPHYEMLFRMAAHHYHMDWKLLAAIAFQESQWDEDAISYTGVRGLMQLTSDTAELAGLQDREDPQESIWGGAYFFRHLWNKLPKGVHQQDRIALTLAAYNMGYGHLRDVQKLALSEGRDPYSWRDIKAMLPKLADSNYFAELKYGESRPYETIDFVERVRGYYSVWNSL